MTLRTARWLVLVLLSAGAAAEAAETGATVGADTDYGPFLTGSLDRDRSVSEKHSNESTEQTGNPNALAAKAVVVRLGDRDHPAAIAFDTDLLRCAAGWTGGFLNLAKTHLTTPKGSVPFAPAGKLAFETPQLPGWSVDGNFHDPRPHPFGPMPKSVGRYKGLYLHGDHVVFSYSVADCDILETFDFEQSKRPGAPFRFRRWFRLSPTRNALSLIVCEPPPGAIATGNTAVRVTPLAGGSLSTTDGRTVLRIPPSDEQRLFAVVISGGLRPDATAASVAATLVDPATLTKGGPSRFGALRKIGVLGTGDGAYVVDSVTLPINNPWGSWVRPSGIDFFPDGRVAVCTLNGEVWVGSGIDDKLQRLEWRRFAVGLYEPLGLRIVGGRVHVLGRDQITRLHDLNDDGEADFYENFNSDAPCSANYHGFAFDLDVDTKGNFYYARAGQRMHPDLPMHGALLRVSPDGSKLEAIAAGLRAANGLCVGPGDLITVADNQGNWTPSSRINVIKPGGFYGYMPHVGAAGGSARDDYDPPLCWIPTSVDNSSGSQVWATDQRFGPLSGRMFHTSYGRAGLMLGVVHKAGDVYQGGVIPLRFKFDSGVMRGRVNPRDGQLYLCGLRGWQTDGSQDGTLARVRYTGKPLYMTTDAKVVAGGVELTFSQPLDPGTAEDPGSYGIERWNYRWSAEYGSPDFSVKEPDRQGRDEVTVESAKLLPDRKTVLLSIPDIRPVMQMKIETDVDAADGTNLHDTLYLTINRVPEQK